MSQYIIKLTDSEKNDYYLLWSTVVDAPITYGLSLDDFKEFYQQEYGKQGMKELPDRLARVEQTGHSAYGGTLDNIISGNRAGEDEAQLTKEQIIEKYCTHPDIDEELTVKEKV